MGQIFALEFGTLNQRFDPGEFVGQSDRELDRSFAGLFVRLFVRSLSLSLAQLSLFLSSACGSVTASWELAGAHAGPIAGDFTNRRLKPANYSSPFAGTPPWRWRPRRRSLVSGAAVCLPLSRRTAKLRERPNGRQLAGRGSCRARRLRLGHCQLLKAPPFN